jgi:hypothetical protein
MLYKDLNVRLANFLCNRCLYRLNAGQSIFCNNLLFNAL